ncbi:MAG: hypothetical protein ABIQ17_07505, partial [Candidatus Limnocylindrales bacterium]
GVDHKEVAVRELESDDLKRDAVPVRPEEYDESIVVWIRWVERTATTLDNKTRAIVGNAMPAC